ncbi:MAG: hypothetical protein ABIP03_00355, partial [Aquihabitans sp.]
CFFELSQPDDPVDSIVTLHVRSIFGTGLLLFFAVRLEPRAYQARTTGVSFVRLATKKCCLMTFCRIDVWVQLRQRHLAEMPRPFFDGNDSMATDFRHHEPRMKVHAINAERTGVLHNYYVLRSRFS